MKVQHALHFVFEDMDDFVKIVGKKNANWDGEIPKKNLRDIKELLCVPESWTLDYLESELQDDSAEIYMQFIDVKI